MTRLIRWCHVGVVIALLTAVLPAAGADEAAMAEKERAEQFFARIATSGPTIDFTRADPLQSIHVQGAFRVASDSKDPRERAQAFLDEGGAARALGYPGRCRVRQVNPGNPVVVRFDFYDGNARIEGAHAIVHIVENTVTYIGGTRPLRTVQRNPAAERTLVTPEQVRSTILDRFFAKGFNPNGRQFEHRQGPRWGLPDGVSKPFDPVEDIQVELLIPAQGPEDVVYAVDALAYQFRVNARTGQIMSETKPPTFMGGQ